MDYLTNLYRHRAEQLQEQVNMLEAMLKDLHEATPTAPKYGTEKRQSGSGMGDSDKMVDWTGGTVNANKSWSQSSGGPAIADSEAGDREIESRMRNLKKTGLFGAKISDDKQSAEYRELQGEQERRKAARAAGSQPPVKQTSGGSGTASAVPTAREVKQTQQTADNTGKATALPTNVTKSGMGLTDEDGRPISVSPKPTAAAPAPQNNGSGIDPKLYVLGGAAALYGAKTLMDRMGRQRGISSKPAEAPKAGEPAKVGETPKPAEAPKPGETTKPKAPEAPKVGEPAVEPGSYSTRDGKIITPKKGAPSVAERSAMGRDALRARMAQKTGNPMSFEGPNRAPEAPDLLRVEPNQAAAEAKWGVEKTNAAIEAPAEWRTSGQMNTRSVTPEAAANWVENPLDFDASSKPSETFPKVGGRQKIVSKAAIRRAKNTPMQGSFGETPVAAESPKMTGGEVKPKVQEVKGMPEIPTTSVAAETAVETGGSSLLKGIKNIGNTKILPKGIVGSLTGNIVGAIGGDLLGQHVLRPIAKTAGADEAVDRYTRGVLSLYPDWAVKAAPSVIGGIKTGIETVLDPLTPLHNAYQRSAEAKAKEDVERAKAGKFGRILPSQKI
jgi:hypothetical protein